MIEIIVLEYLRENLTCPVYMERPEKVKVPYVLIEKTGSRRDGYIYSSTIAIQSYEQSLYKAAALNEKVKHAMDRLAVLNEVSHSELNSDYNHTDPMTKQPRYQAVYDITHY